MIAVLKTAVRQAALTAQRPDGSFYQSLSYAHAQSIATQSGVTLREVEIAALEAGIFPRRYARNGTTLNPNQQATLLKSSVAVAGLGGLGGPVVETLARLGVGGLTLIDGDAFEETNLNRQLLSTVVNIGASKALCASRRVARINPAVQVRVEARNLKAENAEALLAGVNLVMDCLDNLPDRFTLEAGARRSCLPLVSAAVGGTSGQLTVVYPQDEGLQLIYGSPQAAPRHGIEARLGTLPQTVLTLAGLACNEALKILLGSDTGLRRRLLILDLMDNRFDVVEL